jgi:hypothetical protein
MTSRDGFLRRANRPSRVSALEPLEPRLLLDGNGLNAFTLGDVVAAGGGPTGVDAADILADNGPGDRLDFAVADYAASGVAVGWWNSAMTGYTLHQYFGHGSGPVAAKFADFDGDGKQDLVVVNSLSDSITVYFYSAFQGDLVFGHTYSTGAGSQPMAVAVGDFDNRQGPDIAVAEYGSDSVSVFFNDGAGAFGAPVVKNVGNGPMGIAAADFNHDGRVDLATANAAGGGSISYLQSNGAGGFANRVNTNVAHAPGAIAAFDDNADGQPDGIAVTSSRDNNVAALFFNAGNGRFTGAENYTVGSAPVGVVAADLDAAAGNDLAVVNSGDDTVTILHWTGAGGGNNFSTGAGDVYFVGEKPTSIAAGDLRGTGAADLLVSCYRDDAVAALERRSSWSITIGAGAQAAKLRYTEGDGTIVDLAMTGPGSAVCYFGGTNLTAALAKGLLTVTGTQVALDRVAVARTTASSALTFKTTEQGSSAPGAAVGRLTGSTPLGAVTAPTMDLGGTGPGPGTWFSSPNGYIGNLQVRDILAGSQVFMHGAIATGGLTLSARIVGENVSIETFAYIKKLSVTSWADTGGNGGESVEANWIDTIVSKGDFDAALLLSGRDPRTRLALKKADIGGVVHGTDSPWKARGGGGFGAVSAAAFAKGLGGTILPGIQGDGLQSLTVRADCALDLNLYGVNLARPTLGTVKITGNLDGNWAIGENVGTNPTGGAGTIQVTGAVLPTCTIAAGYLGSLTVGGQFQGTLTLSGRGGNTVALGTAKITGAIGASAALNVTGPIGTLSANSIAAIPLAAESIKALTVVHDMAANLTLNGRGLGSSPASPIVLGTAALGQASGGAWTIHGGLNKLTVAGDFAPSVTANFARTMAVTGAYSGALDLDAVGSPAAALSSITVGGNVTSSHWLIGGSGGEGRGGIGKLKVTGNFDAPLTAAFINSLAVDHDYTGDLTLTGCWMGKSALGPTVIKGSVTSSLWDITGGISSLAVAGSLGNGTGEELDAGWIGALTVGGDVYVRLLLSGWEATGPTLGTTKISGGVRSEGWSVQGDIGHVTVTGMLGTQGTMTGWWTSGSIKSLSAGSIWDVDIVAGPYGVPQDASGFLGMQNSGTRIGAITITGTPVGAQPLVSGARFAAAGIGKVRLGRTDFTNSGLYALSKAYGGGGITGVDYADGTTKWSWPTTANAQTAALLHLFGDNAL